MRGAIVTGGTKGLGRAIALALAEAGYEVVALYGSDAAAAETLLTETSARGLPVTALRHDLREVPPAFPTLAASSQLVLVNSAWPAFEPKPLHLLPWADVALGLDVGVRGAYQLAQALLPRMIRAKSGVIVNVLSTAIHDPVSKGFGGYAIAKRALEGLTAALAAEYGARGVRAFSVSPPFMQTPLTDAWDPRLRAALTATAQPPIVADVGRAIVALILDEGSGGGLDYPVP